MLADRFRLVNAHALLHDHAPCAEILKAVDIASRGGICGNSWMRVAIQGKQPSPRTLLAEHRGRAVPTPAERRVAIAPCHPGVPSALEVARQLGGSEGTVRCHRASIYRKLKVNSLPGLVHPALELGWVECGGPDAQRAARKTPSHAVHRVRASQPPSQRAGRSAHVTRDVSSVTRPPLSVARHPSSRRPRPSSRIGGQLPCRPRAASGPGRPFGYQAVRPRFGGFRLWCIQALWLFRRVGFGGRLFGGWRKQWRPSLQTRGAGSSRRKALREGGHPSLALERACAGLRAWPPID